MSLTNGWAVDKKAIEEYVAQKTESVFVEPLIMFLRFEDDLMEKLKYDFYSMTYYAPKSVWINNRGCTFCAMACFKYDLNTKRVTFRYN